MNVTDKLLKGKSDIHFFLMAALAKGERYNMANIKTDRYEGAMLGVAVGDALGAPLEFMSESEIAKNYGTVREMLGGGWLNVEPGEVTDDTQMTLAVAEGLAAENNTAIDPLLTVGVNFLRWYRTRPKDIGATCHAVLSEMNEKYNIICVSDWHKVAKKLEKMTGGQTAGNGALMRTVYPALYFHSATKAENTAVNIARMTHWHKVSDQTVRLYTRVIHTIANSDMDVTEAKRVMEVTMASISAMWTQYGGKRLRPTGYSLDSLMCAINAIRNTDAFEDALVYAVNLGGDADTIGAITGGLAGAIYGASAIPLRWINALENEPNRKIVRLFYESQSTTYKDGENTLAIRLVDLARQAYKRNEQP